MNGVCTWIVVLGQVLFNFDGLVLWLASLNAVGEADEESSLQESKDNEEGKGDQGARFPVLNLVDGASCNLQASVDIGNHVERAPEGGHPLPMCLIELNIGHADVNKATDEWEGMDDGTNTKLLYLFIKCLSLHSSRYDRNRVDNAPVEHHDLDVDGGRGFREPKGDIVPSVIDRGQNGESQSRH